MKSNFSMWNFTWLTIVVHVITANGNNNEYCETCELNSELSSCKLELSECLGKQSFETSKDGSYLDQVCQWIGNPSSTGKSTLKKTVHNFLRATKLDAAKMDPTSNMKEVLVTVSLSNQDLLTLRRFLLNDEGKEAIIQDILASSIQLEEKFGLASSLDLGVVSRFLQHELFAICQIVLCSVTLTFLLWKGMAVWKVSLVIIIGSVTWTWVHLYKVALSRKQATLSRLGNVPQMCLVEKQGWFAAVSDAFYGVLGVKSNKCEAYYEALMVDPFWEVTPLKALTETVSQFVLRPLELCGASVGVFFNEILAPLPFLWKLPVFLVGAVFILFLLLMACRYKIKSPLLFSIEPSRSKKSNAIANRSSSVEGESKRKKLPYPTTPTIIDHLVREKK